MSDYTEPIDSSASVIDSRGVIARIEYLEDIEEEYLLALEREHAGHVEDVESLTEDERIELAALRDFAEDGETNAEDWNHGAILVNDDYFVEYAKEYAEEMGVLGRRASWPYNCIDWESAANELQQNYTELDFDGVTFWAR